MSAGVVLAIAVLPLAAAFEPARLISSSLPRQPPNAVGWTEVMLDVKVDARGIVGGIVPLRATPSATPLVESLVAAWRFRPAREGDDLTRSRVLVAAIFRPPQLHGGPAVGSPPRDLAAASDEVPFPIQQVRPPYPPNVVGDGVVLVEVLVTPQGGVGRARAICKMERPEGETFCISHPYMRSFCPLPYCILKEERTKIWVKNKIQVHNL